MANVTQTSSLTEEQYYNQMAQEYAKMQSQISCAEDKMDKEIEEIMYLKYKESPT